MLTLDEYQALAARTSGNRTVYIPNDEGSRGERRLLIAALGLAGEAGEYVDHVKKICGHHHPCGDAARESMQKELGDVLWYVAELCSTLGFTLSSVAEANIDKLEQRYSGEFTAEKSINRSNGIRRVVTDFGGICQ